MTEQQHETIQQNSLLQCSRVLAVGYIASILITPRLWCLTARSYPRMNYLSVPENLDMMLSLALIASLLTIFVWGLNKTSTLFFAACQLFLIATDALRINTWSFCYTSFICIYGVCALTTESKPKGTDSTLRAWRWLIVAIYFWSGFHKLNASFVLETCPYLLSSLRAMITIPDPVMLLIGISVPFAEAALAIFLLFKRTRLLGVIGLCGMHALIMITFSPVGMGTEEDVIPWNMAMCFLIYLLFRREPVRLTFTWGIKSLIFTVFYALLPSLYSLSMWYGALSFNMYSGRSPHSFIYPSKEEIEKAPETIQALVKEKIGISYIYTSDYSEQEFKSQAFQTISGHIIGLRALCKHFPSAKLLIQDIPPLHKLHGTQYRSTCATFDADVKKGLSPSELRFGKP